MKSILNVKSVKHIFSLAPWIEPTKTVRRIMQEGDGFNYDLGISLHAGRLYLVKWGKNVTEEKAERNKKYLRVPTSEYLFEVVETIALSSLR